MVSTILGTIFIPIIIGMFLLFLEHRTKIFVNNKQNRVNGTRSNIFSVALRNIVRYWIYAIPIWFFLLILESNLIYFMVIRPKAVNTIVITISSIVSLAILIAWATRRSRYTMLYTWCINAQRSTRRALFLWPIVLFLSIVVIMNSPEYFIVTQPLKGNNEAASLVTTHIKRYLRSVQREDIAVRSLRCVIFCQGRESILEDQRVLLNVAGEVTESQAQDPWVKLRFDSNCRREPSPVDKQYASKATCEFEAELPYRDQAFDGYVPIFLLLGLSQTETDEQDLIRLVNGAIESLNSLSKVTSGDGLWSVYEKLFYDLLYNVPGLSKKERIDSAGEVRARAEQFFSGQPRLTFLTARWYEESGIRDSTDYIKAIERYQEAFEQQSAKEEILNALGRVSIALNRHVDAVCYFSESLKLRGNDQTKLLLANALDRIGISRASEKTPIHNSIGQLEIGTTPQDIRSTVVAKNDSSSIDEYLNLAEISYTNKDFDNAFAYAQKVSDSSNSTPAQQASALLLESQIRLSQGNTDAAIKALEAFIDIVEQNNFRTDNLVIGYRWLGSAYHSRGFHDKSAAAFREALRHSVKAQERAFLQSLVAEQERLTGDIDAAIRDFATSHNYLSNIDIYKLPINEQIEYVEILFHYAAVLNDQAEKTKHYQFVADYYSYLIGNIQSNAAQDFKGCEWIGKLVYPDEQNLYSELRRYVAEPVVPIDYWRRMRAANHQLGKSDEIELSARAEITQLEKTAETAVDYYNLGLAYRSINEHQKTIAAMQKAINLDKGGVEDAEDYASQGLSYMDLKDYKQAIKALNLAIQCQIEADQARVADYYFWLGQSYYLDKQYDHAVEAFKNAIKYRQPSAIQKKAGDWYNIGLAYQTWAESDVSKFQLAVDAWKKSIALDNPVETKQNTDPRDIADWVQIAITYRNWSNHDPSKLQEALQSIEKALAIPINKDHGDYIWQEEARKLKQELQPESNTSILFDSLVLGCSVVHLYAGTRFSP